MALGAVTAVLAESGRRAPTSPAPRASAARSPASPAEHRVDVFGIPAAVLREAFDWLDTKGLSRAACVHSEWRRGVRHVAKRRVSIRRPLFEQRDVGPTWTVVLHSLDKLEALVGPRPLRTWRDEWPSMRFEVELQHGTLDWLTICKPLEALHKSGLPGVCEAIDRVFGGGSGQVLLKQLDEFYGTGTGSIESALDGSAPVAQAAVSWKLSQGWSKEIAESWTLLMMYCTAALGRIVCVSNAQRGECVFGAAVWSLVDGFANMARREDYEAGDTYAYKHLQGPGAPGVGLVDHDSSWSVLLQDDVQPGAKLVTTAPLEASAKAACLSPDGYCTPIATTEGVDYAPVGESDIVRFRSRPTDAHGFHALVRSVSTDVESEYDLPPFATVELESIHEAGTWSAFGLEKIPRRLFTVTVTFVC